MQDTTCLLGSTYTPDLSLPQDIQFIPYTTSAFWLIGSYSWFVVVVVGPPTTTHLDRQGLVPVYTFLFMGFYYLLLCIYYLFWLQFFLLVWTI